MKLKELIIRDYLNDNTSKIIKIRKKIFNCKLIIIKALLIRKYNKLTFKCQSFYPLSKEISDDITFPHGISGIFISMNATIKEGCTIFQQVTIGNSGVHNQVEHVIIGDNVIIGAGAKIIGNIEIGNNVVIGANAVVTKNIPDNCTVVEFNKIIKK